MILVLLAVGGFAFAEPQTGDPAPGEPGGDRLARFRALSPEDNPVETIDIGRRILADLDGAEEPAIEAEIRAGIGQALRFSEDFNAAVVEFQAASALARQSGLNEIRESSLAGLARVQFHLGEFDHCLAACREALSIPAVADDPDRSWVFMNIMSACQLQQGDFRAAIETASRALEGRQRAGDRHAEATLLNNIGVAHMYLGENDAALEYFQRSRVLKSELGETRGVADILSNIGDIRHLQGHSGQAVEIHIEALALRQAEGGERRIALSHRSLAAAFHAEGRDAEALEHIEAALSIASRLDLEPELATALAIKAQVLAALGRGREAVSTANQSVELARSMGMKAREVVALNALIEAQTAIGDTAGAFESQERARELESELLSIEIRSDFAKFQAAFEAREKEREIELLRKDNELQRLEIRHNDLWRNSLIAGMVILLVLAVAGWHRFLAKRRENDDRKRADAALLQSMERYRLLFERNLAGIFQADLDGKIITTNQAFATMLGHREISDLQGRSISELAAEPGDFHRFFGDFRDLREVHNLEFTLTTRTGEPASILMNASVIADTERGTELIEGIAVDISARNRAEEDRRRLELQLQQSQKLESLGVLAGGIAHDFNNMLMAILSNISLAKRSASGSDETLRRLNEAEEVCLRATGLTQQLLTFSKGGRPIRKTTSIEGLVKEASDFTLRSSNCTLDAESGEDLWSVDIDEGQIVQVIQNLVLNAMQAMPDGGEVTVTTDNTHLTAGDVPTLEAGRFVRIEVIDTGEGIPEAQLEQIFDPFFTTKQGGSGLGLSTAFSIIRSHGGAIVVRSTPEKGSKFTVYIPASDEAHAESQAQTEESIQGHGRLLIMDDDEAVRSAAAELLETIGYEVATAGDGAEAVELYAEAMAAEHRFDAVVLDLTVPEGVGGRETMTRLLEIDPGVKAIVSSGYSTDPVMANYREHGFSGVAVKPYRLADLVQTLRGAIDENT